MGVEPLLAALVEDTATRLEEMAAAKELTYVNERDHQAKCFLAALQSGLSGTGFREAGEGERQLNWPEHWPRVGDVDALLVPTNGEKPTFVELKCGSDNKALRACGWDAVKCALAVRLGAAKDAYLLGATTRALWAKPVLGSALFGNRRWRSEKVRQDFKRAFVEYERCDDPPPTRVPAEFETRCISRSSFLVGRTPWEIRLARVLPSADGWFEWTRFLTSEEQAVAREWRRNRGARSGRR